MLYKQTLEITEKGNQDREEKKRSRQWLTAPCKLLLACHHPSLRGDTTKVFKVTTKTERTRNAKFKLQQGSFKLDGKNIFLIVSNEVLKWITLEPRDSTSLEVFKERLEAPCQVQVSYR